MSAIGTRPARPSLVDLALAAKRVLILGNGGGGDVIMGVPILNLLRTLGRPT